MSNQENYEGVFQNSIDAQVIIDPDSGNIIKVNDAVLDLFNLSEEEIIDKNFDKMFLQEVEKPSPKAFMQNAAFRDGVIFREFRNNKGEVIPVEIIFSLIPWSGKTAMLASMRNIRERKAAELELAEAYRKLEILSRTDPLTNLANRRALLDNMNHEKFRFERSHETFSIIICDIDNYKFINDNYGHNAGDFVLKEIGNIMINKLRKQDIVGRWGGDEFLMILPQTNVDGARILANIIRERIDSHVFKYKDFKIKLTMSFGTSEFKESFSIHECIRSADEALYQAKKEGKNKVK
ncbi:MAG: sensor domain-containing diguanylate cyclase [Candidatus Cloacimonetes bacterium]|nr:sensor domain-containing diguanylate cyclase [Candidatus Cloacimonadota bacterium]MCF7814097.1 sensor domain-containing diguanylate cyclase [Candidatus Cloacimonadota bacterium]MCF7867974.1 sensor domain-containing diguanylate cyclase [Candidatus Cloacimonadota bacterium]MCF7883432.1 sensor domain-containing diguanylate cyclase [Candidatus Cloacimonadota bacterium]